MSTEKGVQITQGFTLEQPDRLDEIYVDGVSGLVAGWPNSKLLFHSVYPRKPGDTNPAENRRANLVVTIPTTVLIEMSRNLLGTFTNAQPQLKEAAGLHLSKTLEMLAQPESESQSVKKAK